MKKISCSFANHSNAEIGINIEGVSFIIPGNSVGAKLFSVEVEPDVIPFIQAWLADKHPYVVVTIGASGVENSSKSYQSVFLNAANSGVTDGTFQLITLPDGIECDAILIQIHNGEDNDFTTFHANPPGFHFSSTGDGVGKDFTQHRGCLSIDLQKIKGSNIGYVRAVSGNYVTIMVVKNDHN